MTMAQQRYCLLRLLGRRGSQTECVLTVLSPLSFQPRVLYQLDRITRTQIEKFLETCRDKYMR